MRNIITAITLLVPMIFVMAQPPRDDWERGDRENMKTMGVWRLTEELELTELQAEKFFPKFRAQREKMDELRKAGKESLESIRNSLREGKDISDQDIQDALKKFRELEQEKIDSQITFVESLEGTLTNTQRAKLLLVPHKMRQEARRNIEEHKQFRNRRDRMNRWR